MNHTEIVKKLIGSVQPAGDASRDPERFENLKAMCELTANLIAEIQSVASQKDRYEASVKKMAVHASNFLTEEIGIKEDTE